MKASDSTVQLGVIEGFYGRDWSTSDRLHVVDQLSELNYSEFIFAPKSEQALRSHWKKPWLDSALESHQHLAAHCHKRGLRFGVGFSPLGLDDLSVKADRAALAQKVEQLNLMGVDRLCILFDDMKSSGGKMAVNQLAIVDYITEKSTASSFVVCPTYYSTDNLLEKVFGERPKNYWKDIGRGLEKSIHLFWTGEKVCSDSFDKLNLEYISDQFNRAPILWDNYPVNDGEHKSQFLNLLPFENRAVWLQNYVEAHYVNPMNQPLLSLLPLSTLPEIYQFDKLGSEGGGSEPREKEQLLQLWATYVAGCCGDAAQSLIADAELFQCEGLQGMSDDTKKKKLSHYRSLSSPFAAEVIGWLDGQYVFDPACLTG